MLAALVCRVSHRNLRDCFHLDQRSRRAHRKIPRSAFSSAGSEGARVYSVACAPVALWSKFFRHNGDRISARMLEFIMNSTAIAGPRARSRLTLIVAGIVALLGSAVVTAPAQAGYYDASYPCSYRCGYPAYRYYPTYRHRCYSCGSRLIYERRYIERQYVERRYAYGGYRRHHGYYPYGGYRRHYGYSPYGGYRRQYGYAPYGSYRSWSRPWGYGNGSGGVGRRWSPPYF